MYLYRTRYVVYKRKPKQKRQSKNVLNTNIKPIVIRVLILLYADRNKKRVEVVLDSAAA